MQVPEARLEPCRVDAVTGPLELVQLIMTPFTGLRL